MHRLALSTLAGAFLSGPASACGLALALLIDISGSVDPREYRIQIDGLAAGLRDGIVSEALVREAAAVTLIQWTGSSRQEVSIPWTRIHSFEDVDALATRIEGVERTWAMFATAIGEALNVAEETLASGPDCRRRVIDVSGDGLSNEGVAPSEVRDRLVAQGVTINALVITGSEPALMPYFRREVIGGHGAFAMEANGYEEYPDRIRDKLIRETARALSSLEAPTRPGP